MLEKSTSLTSAGYTAGSVWKAGWRKMIAAKPIITGAHTTALITPYMAALRCAAYAVSSDGCGG